MNDVTFAHPLLLLALAVVPVAYAGWLLGVRRGAARARFLSRAGAGRAPYGVALLLALAASSAIVAAAGPRWDTRPSAVFRSGTDVIIVMDVSRSMEATDVQPNRLDAAKTAANDAIQRLGGDRVGLVVFGGSARIRFPLTTDLTAAAEVVSSLETGPVFVEGGSNAADGLALAIEAFDPESEAGRLIVLVSDGENLGADPAGVAQQIRAAGIDLLVAGVGTAEGSTVPVYDPGKKAFIDKLDANGEPIVSRLDETFLRAMATAAGGRYVGANPGAIPGAVANRVSQLERASVESRTSEVPIERFQWFAGAAIALVVLASIADRLPRFQRRRALVSALAASLLVLTASCAEEPYTLNEQAREAYRAGDFERSVELFAEARTQRPNDPSIDLNLAAALHQAGRYEEAIQAARRALLSTNDSVHARAYASIGHHQFEMQQLEAALESFKQVLLIEPGDQDARHDYEVVLRMLSTPPEEEQQQPDQQPGSEAPEDQPTAPGQGNQQPDENDQENGDSEQQQPGQQPGGQGGGSPRDAAQIERRMDEIDAEVASILREAEDSPNASEALRILELLAERSRLAAQRSSLSGQSDPNDY